MIFDPLSAIVVVGALGFSGVLRNRDEQIFDALEKRVGQLPADQHRIVIDYKPEQILVSSMMLNKED